LRVGTHRWRRKNPDLISSRIDFWLIQKSIIDSVVKCDIRCSIKTDHQAIFLKLLLTDFARGPGVWRFNTSHLSDDCYVNGVKSTLIDVVKEFKDNNVSKQMLWEICKNKIKDFTDKFSRQKAFQLNNYLVRLETQLTELDKKIDETLDKDALDVYAQVKSKVETIYEYKAKGAQVRSREQWIEKGERSNKYFLSLESSRSKQNNITRLKHENREETNPFKILDLEAAFYENLYCCDNPAADEQIDTFLESVDVPSLSDEDRLLLDDPVTKKRMFFSFEIHEAK